MITLLACSWAALLSLPLTVRARRVAAADRARRLVDRPRKSRVAITDKLVSSRALRVLIVPRRRRAARVRSDQLLRELSVAVDLVNVGVGAGCTPYLAVDLGAQWSPPAMRDAFSRVVHACHAGQTFDDALRELGARMPTTRPLTDALRMSARLGTAVAPALARLSSDVRTDLRRRAEARARTVPVRLCFPLVLCILPAFALLTVVPVVLDGLHR